jgi:hypothetical protein
MFDVPVDAWYVWVGLTVVGAATLGIASGLPASPPPDADAAAETVDGVAASQHARVDRHELSNADSIRIGVDFLSLRGPGGTVHAQFGYGPVTPALGDELGAVLIGAHPGMVSESPTAFERAIRDARERRPQWQQADRLVVRRVSWEDVDAILVG